MDRPPASPWRWFPGATTLRHYEARWLRHDLIAGLVLTAVLVPVGIAYAVASGVPAICGLYATVFGLLAYALFGPSRVLVVGPDSSLVAIVIGVVAPLAAGDPQRAMALAGMMAVIAGLLCILAGVARLGFVTELLSKPIRYGYMNGIALTVLAGQLPALFGITVQGDDIVAISRALVRALIGGEAHGPSLALGLMTLVLIVALKRFTRLPGVLIAVVAATVTVTLLDLSHSGVAVLGVLPQGLPAFAWPSLGAGDWAAVATGSFALALVAFADMSVLSRSFAAREGQRVSANQEMIGLGAANLAAGLFQGLAVGASSSRTPVAQAAGAKTQLAGVIGAIGVAALLLFAPALIENLPKASLAAVVIVAALGLIEVRDLRRIHRIQRWEFWLSMGCLAGVAVLGPIPGIGLAIVIAVIEFLWDGWRPHSAVLGRVDGIKGYHDIKRHPQARLIPGLVLFRWDAPLFFANAELFADRVLDAVAASPTPVRRVVVGSEPITSVDVTAADALDELDRTLREAGIELCFAEMKDPVKDKLVRFGLFERFGGERFAPTVGEAVSSYLQAHAVPWVDWEDRR